MSDPFGEPTELTKPEYTSADWMLRPSSRTCQCNCPKHCAHIWDGPVVDRETTEYYPYKTVTCGRCGMDKSTHDAFIL